jgi:3-deoxy-7-phosphoheptulonate synthase
MTRMGRERAAERVAPLVAAMRGRRVLWLCDPMHGNTTTRADGRKTRDVADILAEVRDTSEAHRAAGGRLGGLHVELTGDDVTECLGVGVTGDDLDQRYETACDPRLNRAQALQVALSVAGFARGSDPRRCLPST